MRYSRNTLFIGGWLWVLVTGAILQWWIIPATPWHAGNGLLAGGDWIMFHEQALRLSAAIERFGWWVWELRYEGQAPASFAAAFYALTGIRQPWILLPFHGLLYAIAIVAAVSIGRALGVGGRFTWLILVAFVFPSSLLVYGQLHKDIFSLPGVMLMAWAWVMALDRQSLSWRLFGAMTAAIVFGVLLCWWVRPYQAQLLLGVSALLWLGAFLVAIWQGQWGSVGKATLVLVCTVTTIQSAEKMAAPAAPLCETWKPEVELPVVGRHVAALFCYRHGFIRYLSDGSANIDHDRLLTNYTDAVIYLPRALQLGLFAPFPSHWWGDASSPGGKIKRLIGGMEMLFVYGALLGLLWIYRDDRHRVAALAVMVLAIAGILFYVYTSPNYGALYRYRLPFMLLLIIVASAGWARKINVRQTIRGAGCKR